MRYCCHHVFLLWGCGSDGQRPVRGHSFAGYSNQLLDLNATHFTLQFMSLCTFSPWSPSMMSWLCRMLSMLLAAVCEQREFRSGHIKRGNG